METTVITVDKIKSEVEFKLNILFNCIKFIGVRETNLEYVGYAMRLEFDNIDVYLHKLDVTSITGFIYMERRLFNFSYSDNVWTWS